ncbi:MAG: cytochrome c family protein [Candidatus Marinimicrobia bacterium]|nr:cytochrome c family protein [Candidatus Neomarinimicrobiota bacterium]MCF7850847.1 cytochrome c family protein [Candidatus Neomarinimicrobiota bacterium]
MKTLQFISLLLVVVVALSAADYIGSDKCKICHRKDTSGEQYPIWSSGPHANSFETLKSDQSKAIAKKMGLKVAPDQAPECLKCHVTGWENGGYQLEVDPEDRRAMKTNDDLARVGCESCHGPGSEYKSKKTMVGIFDGELKGEDYGLIAINEKTCTSCHNDESPTFKKFDFAERVKEIAHPVPPR